MNNPRILPRIAAALGLFFAIIFSLCIVTIDESLGPTRLYNPVQVASAGAYGNETPHPFYARAEELSREMDTAVSVEKIENGKNIIYTTSGGKGGAWLRDGHHSLFRLNDAEVRPLSALSSQPPQHTYLTEDAASAESLRNLAASMGMDTNPLAGNLQSIITDLIGVSIIIAVLIIFFLFFSSEILSAKNTAIERLHGYSFGASYARTSAIYLRPILLPVALLYIAAHIALLTVTDPRTLVPVVGYECALMCLFAATIILGRTSALLALRRQSLVAALKGRIPHKFTVAAGGIFLVATLLATMTTITQAAAFHRQYEKEEAQAHLWAAHADTVTISMTGALHLEKIDQYNDIIMPHIDSLIQRDELLFASSESPAPGDTVIAFRNRIAAQQGIRDEGTREALSQAIARHGIDHGFILTEDGVPTEDLPDIINTRCKEVTSCIQVQVPDTTAFTWKYNYGPFQPDLQEQPDYLVVLPTEAFIPRSGAAGFLAQNSFQFTNKEALNALLADPQLSFLIPATRTTSSEWLDGHRATANMLKMTQLSAACAVILILAVAISVLWVIALSRRQLTRVYYLHGHSALKRQWPTLAFLASIGAIMAAWLGIRIYRVAATRKHFAGLQGMTEQWDPGTSGIIALSLLFATICAAGIIFAIFSDRSMVRTRTP